MKIHRIFLSGFKPFTHGGIHTLDWKITKSISIICANNGIGKSSLLRELTPYPATRTDYTETGKKIIEISHEGSYYVLTSDFTNKKAHSFIKDNEELNLSGNTDIQQDLCRKHFNFDSQVQRLVNGLYNFCDMGRTDRKGLFLQFYPNDLTFINDHYKRILSQMRSFQNNRKLLLDRQSTLKSQLVDDARKEQLSKQLKEYDDMLAIIAKEIIIYSAEVDKLQQRIEHAQYREYTETEVISAYQDMLRLFNLAYQASLIFLEEFTYSVSTHTATILTERCKQLFHHKQEMNEEIQSLSTQLNELEQMSLVDTKAEKQKLSEEISAIKQQLNEFRVNNNIPIITDESQFRYFKDTYPTWLGYLDRIGEYVNNGNCLYTSDEITTLRNTLSNEEAWLMYHEPELQNLNTAIEEKLNRIEQLKHKLPPEDCNFEQCSLRKSINSLFLTANSEHQQLLLKRDELQQKIDHAKHEINALKSGVQGYSSVEPYLTQISEIIHRNLWVNFLLNSDSLESVLKMNVVEFGNNLRKIIQNSENYFSTQKIQQSLNESINKLDALSKVHTPAKAVLEKLLAETTVALNHKIELFGKLENDLAKYSTEYEHAKTFFDLVQQTKNSITEFQHRVNCIKLKLELQDKTNYLQAAKSAHGIVASESTEIRSTLNEQRSIQERLELEIIPMLKDTEEKYERWSIIEAALSPTRGFPKQRLIRFINAVLVKVNAVLNTVWTYNMELSYLTEDDDLSFDFKVILNKRAELKDINICSRGQKDIINLAFLLAFCSECKYGRQYPVQFDEVDAQFSEIHRTSLLNLIGEMSRQEFKVNDLREIWFQQLFMVNHYASLYSSFADADIVCLSEEGIVVPNHYNENVVIA